MHCVNQIPENKEMERKKAKKVSHHFLVYTPTVSCDVYMVSSF